jgi:Predicted metal-dependent hydrolase with the TIM-barrel fold
MVTMGNIKSTRVHASAVKPADTDTKLQTAVNQDTTADYVLKNGVIQTMVSENDVAEAIAVKGNVIVYVGTNSGVEKYTDKDTKVIDLKGAMVTPGFMDGHIHPPAEFVTKLFEINLSGATAKEEYLKIIKKFVTEHPDAAQYTGGAYSMNVFMKKDGSNPGPSKKDLDAICKDKPIVLNDVSHHNVWCNSYALNKAGITKKTKNPKGGNIFRDKSGAPSGQLADTAVNLLNGIGTLKLTQAQQKEALVEFMKQCNQYGITGLTNIDMSGSDETKLFMELEKEGLQTLRVRHAYNSPENESAKDTIKAVKALQEQETDMNKSGTVKFWLDGVTESATAYMLEPYLKSAGHGTKWYGESKYKNNKDFIKKVVAIDAAGLQCHVHAIGDGAVDLTLDAFTAAQKANHRDDPRFTMTHVCAITDKDIERDAKLKVINNLQFVWMYGDSLFDLEKAYIGEKRALAMYPTLKMKQAGCIISGGSDGPVTSYSPLEEIEVGVTRNSPYPGEEDTNMYRAADQALTAYDVLQAYTSNVAYQNYMDKEVGTIEAGKKADLVVLSQNILKCDPKKISDTQVLYTISNGKIVYQKNN